jgi:transcriptional regulator with XRE-family HTH domain
MIVGQRLQALREEKKLLQGDIEKRTGLFRCYISRVENGHTIPSVATLEKMARALEMPLYQVLYDGNKPPQAPARNGADETAWGSHGKDARFLHKICGCLSRMKQHDRDLLIGLAENITRRKVKRG